MKLSFVKVSYHSTKVKYFGLPGVGLNAGVALLNLTRWTPAVALYSDTIVTIRLRDLPGGGFSETVRYIWEKQPRLSLADQVSI